eukprot:CAMPEP_0203784196 /NCGR_PEP_ID=MMETSP0100_2-20121128/328_1 /ASSEMBLY_ACC=CAM_ASM_000210 /TAXON_ID=96639 /ORGANISM=" , Strain NY0313808BC1" /LENGTH=358 /DNA_ID=CAMNT_0050686143 /DNA_START=616 /DNA_END=1692 /DNA_ORIENTATION=+
MPTSNRFVLKFMFLMCTLLPYHTAGNEVAWDYHLGLDQPPIDEKLARMLFAENWPAAKVDDFERVQNPVNVLAWGYGGDLLVASFMSNTIIVKPLSKREKPYVLVDAGIHCNRHICTKLDGPWGMAQDPNPVNRYHVGGTHEGELVVSSFGTDQVLRFALFRSIHNNRLFAQFITMFGDSDSLDCPEGLAFSPNGDIYVASFLGDKIAIFSREKQTDEYAFTSFYEENSLTMLDGPEEICFSQRGDLVVASQFSNQVFHFIHSNDTHYAHKIPSPVGLVCMENAVIVSSYNTNQLYRIHLDNGETDVIVKGSGLRGPSGMTLSLDAHILYTCSYENNVIASFNISTGAAYDIATSLYA